MESSNLEQIFKSFAGGKNEMSNKEFPKLNKDCGLLDKKYTTTDVDIIFTKVKDKNGKNIYYSQFSKAVEMIALKKGLDFSSLSEIIIKTGGLKSE